MNFSCVFCWELKNKVELFVIKIKSLKKPSNIGLLPNILTNPQKLSLNIISKSKLFLPKQRLKMKINRRKRRQSEEINFKFSIFNNIFRLTEFFPLLNFYHFKLNIELEIRSISFSQHSTTSINEIFFLFFKSLFLHYYCSVVNFFSLFCCCYFVQVLTKTFSSLSSIFK